MSNLKKNKREISFKKTAFEDIKKCRKNKKER